VTFRDKTVLSALIWVCVYPGVLVVTWLFQAVGLEFDLWLELLLSTAITVPLISLLAAPQMERVLARMKGESAAELKVDQARDAPGPSPEEIVERRAVASRGE
jgi:antibiotic biosynthesis monooxygenase (ABM) superfamily enzyme